MADIPQSRGTAGGRYKALDASVNQVAPKNVPRNAVSATPENQKAASSKTNYFDQPYAERNDIAAPQSATESTGLSAVDVLSGAGRPANAERSTRPKIFEQLHASCASGRPPDKSSGRPNAAPFCDGEGDKGTKKRARPLDARVSDEVRDRVLKICEERGISPNRFCAAAIEAAAFGKDFVAPIPLSFIEKLQELLHHWLVEMVRQGNNLNQLTASVNRAVLKDEPLPPVAAGIAEIKLDQKSIIAVLAELQKWVLSLKSPFTINDGDRCP